MNLFYQFGKSYKDYSRYKFEIYLDSIHDEKKSVEKQYKLIQFFWFKGLNNE